jgi:hypothetical protein
VLVPAAALKARMMNTETRLDEERGEGDLPADRRRRAAPACAPAEFVYDGGQIMLELLRGRAAEEERRRFVAGLRRIDVRANREE